MNKTFEKEVDTCNGERKIKYFTKRVTVFIHHRTINTEVSIALLAAMGLTFCHGVKVVLVALATTIDELFTQTRVTVKIVSREVAQTQTCFWQ